MEHLEKNVKKKTKSKSSATVSKSTTSQQLWPLNPMVSMVGTAGWLEMAKESSQFFATRLEKDLEAQRQFLNCKSLEDVLRLQSEFCRDSLEQYTAEFQRMAELWSQTMAMGMSEATAPRARNYDDIPL